MEHSFDSEVLEQNACRIERISSEDTIQLRHSVLWPEMPRAHVVLAEDAEGMHFGAFLPCSTQPVAVVSIFREAIPMLNQEGMKGEAASTYLPIAGMEAVRFRKFACDPQCQGKGLGTQLLLHALSIARSELGVSVAWCDARRSTQEWYAKRGFVSFGHTFFKGHVEYVRMMRDFASPVDVPRPPGVE